ncbi:MAG TPA: DNA recombination protein RmuC [Treponemataceae bacterium]|nr:DNA recombination protein RmuC [Treponemataceae bacterium]
MNIIFIVLLALILAVVIAQFVIILIVLRRVSNGLQEQVLQKLEEYGSRLEKNETVLRDEFSRNRDETAKSASIARDELTGTFTKFSSLLEQKLTGIQDSVNLSGKQNREELALSLKSFETKVDGMRDSVEKKLTSIQEDNSAKLEKMRETVDEKLHKTLETRLGESFKLVSDRLELVQKGLGEMQTLATGVGDLKKVLSNVKTKGVLGEYQLSAILEQLLTPAQYEPNVKTKKGSNDLVEFAVKIPNKEDSSRILWLPIDAKFPTEDYTRLMNAYDLGDAGEIEAGTKALKGKIEKFAKDINTKYIDPPNTTDFAIMFLPFEGLFAEVLRIPGLFESIQREYKITITGPTTISAFLSSLQMGFRSLAVEKRTSEIWSLLGTVKTEFGKFGDVLEKTKKKLDDASKEIDSAGARSRAIERKLRDVQELPDGKSVAMIEIEENNS